MNPYTPPETEVADAPKPPGAPAKAVFLGLLADVGGTTMAGFLYGLLYSIVLIADGASPEEAQQQIAASSQSGWGFALLTVVGYGCSVLGGFVCARLSRRTDFRLGYFVAAGSVTAGLLLGGTGYALDEALRAAALTVACVLLGTWLGMRRAAR